MPRHRMLTFDIWTDAKYSNVSHAAMLLSLAMLSYCDDRGVIENDIKMLSYIAPRFNRNKIEKLLNELVRFDLCRLSFDNRFILMTKFTSQIIKTVKIEKVTLNEFQNIEWKTIVGDPGNKIKQNKIKQNKFLTGDSKVTKEKRTASGASGKQKTPSEIAPLIGSWVEAWKSRYKTRPPIGGKDRGILLRLLKDYGLVRVQNLMRAYIDMNDHFYLTKRHDLVTLEANISAVTAKLDSGITISRKNAIMAEDFSTPAINPNFVAQQKMLDDVERFGQEQARKLEQQKMLEMEKQNEFWQLSERESEDSAGQYFPFESDEEAQRVLDDETARD